MNKSKNNKPGEFDGKTNQKDRLLRMMFNTFNKGINMNKLFKTLLLFSTIFFSYGSMAAAEDFTVIYEMIDRLEARINKLDNNQNKELEKLTAKLANLKNGGNESAEYASLNSRLDQFAQDLEDVKSTQGKTEENQDINGLIADLRGLTTELNKTIDKAASKKEQNSAKIPGKSKLSGYMFGDYYYEFSHPDSAANSEGRNSFRFRRIYLTYDNQLSGNFSVRFRLEMKSKTGETVSPFVKNAYLTWKNVIPHASLYFGIQGTPIWKVSEKVWGYRSVEATIMDQRKSGSSADMGLGVKGKFTESGTVGYHVLFANGSGKKGEGDSYKKVYLSIPVKIFKDFHAAPFFDYEGRSNNRYKQLTALFVGVTKKHFHGGVEVFQKTHHKEFGNADLVENGYSVFGAVNFTDAVKGFVRYDHFDPNTDLKKDAKNLIISGVDIKFHKNVHLIPNVRVETYEADNTRSNTVGNATFYYKF